MLELNYLGLVHTNTHYNVHTYYIIPSSKASFNPAVATAHGTLAIPFTLLCQCLSEETVNVVGSFYLVFMPRKVK